MGCMEKVKTSNISGTMPLIKFILSPYVWKNWLLNKNYWDDLGIIDQGHSKSDVSQFCLYLSYPWKFFYKISTMMMESWQVTKTRSIILPWKCRSRSPFTKIAVFQLQYNRFLPKLYRNDSNVVGNKNVISGWPLRWRPRSPLTKIIISQHS